MVTLRYGFTSIDRFCADLLSIGVIKGYALIGFGDETPGKIALIHLDTNDAAAEIAAYAVHDS